jgi:hypothetical protein
VFAANQSAEYEWTSFKELGLKGIRCLLNSYPRLENYPFRPVHLELRYVDVFDQSLLGTTDLLPFTAAGTTFDLRAPAFLENPSKFGPITGRTILRAPIRDWEKTEFVVDYGNSRVAQEPAIRLETKVITTAFPKQLTTKNLIQHVSKWLEFAHSLTSPFFKNFVSDTVMRKFRESA